MSSAADDALRMLHAGALVAAVVVPVAVASALVARWRFGRVCPRWRLPPFVWHGAAVLGFFIAYLFSSELVPLADRAGLFRFVYPHGFPPPPPGLSDADAVALTGYIKRWWVSLGTVPLLLLAAVAVRGWVFNAPVRWLSGVRELPRSVALGLAGFLTFGVAASALHVGLTLLYEWAGTPVTEHPLSKMGAGGDGYGGLLLVLSACMTAPLMEEFLFRGLLVPWVGRRWYGPWCLLLPAGAVAFTAPPPFVSQSLGFVLVLGVGAYLIQRFGKRRPKFPARTVLAVWSSAALFAVVHSAVWPSPFAMFVLGLGLGYLTARTRSWAASAVCHATFNAVGTAWVFLRG